MTARIPGVRWIIAALVFSSAVINYIDRQVLSVLAPQLTRSLHLSEIEYSRVVQAFLIGYTAMYIPAGLALARWGVRWVYTAATVWWSIAAMLHAVATSALDLGAYRFLLGVGEAFTFIAATVVAAEWYPPKERALLNGIANAAAVTGAIVTPPLVVWMSFTWGWRATFIVTGALGIIWLAGWLFFYYRPERHPFVTPKELALVTSAGIDQTVLPESGRGHWLELLKLRETWGLLVSRIFSDPVWWFYLFWLPKYLTESRGMSMQEMSAIVWIPYLASDIGSIAGGWFSGWLIRRGWRVLPARDLAMALSVALMPMGVLIVYTKSSFVAVALMCVVLFAHMSWKTNLMTLTVDVFPQPVVSTVAGVVGTGSGIGAALFTSLVGYLLQHLSYTPVFWIIGFLHPIAYLCVRATVKDRARVDEGRS